MKCEVTSLMKVRRINSSGFSSRVFINAIQEIRVIFTTYIISQIILGIKVNAEFFYMVFLDFILKL